MSKWRETTFWHTASVPDLRMVKTDPRLADLVSNPRYDLIHRKTDSSGWGVPRHTFEIAPKSSGPHIKTMPGYRKNIFYDSNLAHPGDQRAELHDSSAGEFPWGDQAEPGYLYRGVSKEEMDHIRDNGQIMSHGNYNLPGQENTTSYATNPRTAHSYATGFAPQNHRPSFTHPGYILKVDANQVPLKDMKLPDDEVSASGPVPASAIHGAVEAKPYAIHAGETDIADRALWEGGNPRGEYRQGSGSGTSEQMAYREMDPSELTPRVAAFADHDLPGRCPTCGDELSHGKCKRCNWIAGPNNAMTDADSNPPDPTRDMKPAIQS